MKKTTLRRLSALFATAVMAVSCGTMSTSAQAGTASMGLTETSAVAGKCVTVDLVLNTGNVCSGYNVDIEFDSELVLKSVQGVTASCQIENVVTLIEFTGAYLPDDEAVATLTFEVPEDAAEGQKYDIRIQKITNFCKDNEEFKNVITNNSSINVVESAKNVTNHKVYIDNQNKTEVALRGDANCEGRVDLYDAIAITKKMMGKEKFNQKQEFFADVNEDGKVDLYDTIAICMYSMASDKDNAWGEIIF